VFLFDKGYSAYVLCRALGGTHYDILSPKLSPAFYPLKNIHEPDELNWACEWIEECLQANNFIVNNLHRNLIREGLVRLSASESRTLTELQSCIQDRDIQQALEFFTLSGEMGSVLDAAEDDLRQGRFQVFEMENIIQKGAARLLPTLLYIFHQITKRLNGKPTLILIEEGHHFTQGKFGEQLDKWLLELRKKNAGVVFITQDPSHVLKTEHKENLFNNCFTKIYLPNSSADNELNIQNYQAIGLTNKQIQIIKTAIPKQHYYITSRLGNRLIDLGLGDLSKCFLTVDGDKDRNRVDELTHQYGDQWISHWLEERGLPEWSHYWKKLYGQFNSSHHDFARISA
jgi:type IV secretion system protein VirB4